MNDSVGNDWQIAILVNLLMSIKDRRFHVQFTYTLFQPAFKHVNNEGFSQLPATMMFSLCNFYKTA